MTETISLRINTCLEYPESIHYTYGLKWTIPLAHTPTPTPSPLRSHLAPPGHPHSPLSPLLPPPPCPHHTLCITLSSPPPNLPLTPTTPYPYLVSTLRYSIYISVSVVSNSQFICTTVSFIYILFIKPLCTVSSIAPLHPCILYSLCIYFCTYFILFLIFIL